MPKTCIIIPCYNEAQRLDIVSFENFLSKEDDFALCFGDDGSTDDTMIILQRMQSNFPGRIFVVREELNVGKAEIVRKGINEMYSKAVFDYFGYFDADLSTPLEVALTFIGSLEQNRVQQIVFGSRIEKPGTVIQKNYFRHISGRTFAFLVNQYFHLTLHDTQCGAKIFRKEIVPLAFDEPFISRWLFDIEIMLRLRKQYSNDDSFIEEKALLLWVNKKGSKITLSDLLRLPVQLIKIKRNYK
ncbi:MAG: glycosyltransferase [Sphingobacteriales bacterium]